MKTKKYYVSFGLLLIVLCLFVSCKPQTKILYKTTNVDVVVNNKGGDGSTGRGLASGNGKEEILLEFGTMDNITFEYMMVPLWAKEDDPNVVNPSDGPLHAVTDDWVWNESPDSSWKVLASETQELGEATVDVGLWKIFVRAMGNVDGKRIRLYEGSVSLYLTQTNHSFFVMMSPNGNSEVKGNIVVNASFPITTTDTSDYRFQYTLTDCYDFGKDQEPVEIDQSAITYDDDQHVVSVSFRIKDVPMSCYLLKLTINQKESLLGGKYWNVNIYPSLSKLGEGNCPNFLTTSK